MQQRKESADAVQSLEESAIEEKVDTLLAAMTLEEKVGQLVQPFGWEVYESKEGKIELTEAFKEQIKRGGIGALYGTLRADPWTGVTLATGLTPEQGAEAINEIQRYAIEHSRLGIPLLIGEECSHGHMAIGATVFPVPLLTGSTWNVGLYRRMCRAVAEETRAQGGTVTYSPVLDVVRDPRWGRTEECFGEDPFMIGEFAVAAVEGMHGDGVGREDSVAVTLKHFAGYGSSEGGRNAGPVHMGWRELLEVDLHPFRRAVEAGALSVMPAYNEIDGVPCTVNGQLLNEVLRDEWGFDGMVITDCGAIEMLTGGHGTSGDGQSAAISALEAGIDMEMSGVMFGRYLADAVRDGKLEERVLEQAVRRVLKLKAKLGLFERPYADPERAKEIIGCSEHKHLARQIAAEGIVLLKNKGRTLPLAPDCGTIAVIGPNADQGYNQLGDYTSPQPAGSIATVLAGIRERFGGEEGRVLYAPGCRIKGDDRAGFNHAVATAAAADVIVMAAGGSSARDFGDGTIDLKTGASIVSDSAWNEMDCGEGIDRMSLRLSGVQLELLQELRKLDKPLIVVYINGRPVAEPWVDEHADAILEAWYPGQEGGRAVADILFGDVNPSGRLTVSIPKSAGQLPVYYNGKRSRGKRYLESDSEPQYPFGFGLSYTTFRYSNLAVMPNVIPADGQATVTVDVTNDGDRAGMETVQLYVTDEVSSVTRPAKELKGFDKIMLQPGETKTVTFKLGREQLSFIGLHYKPVVEPGDFLIHAGSHVKDTICAKLTVREGGE